MSPLSVADQVWNRACQLVGRPGPKSGDTELSAMLLAHGLVMNGGVLHCVETLSTEELDSALHGFRYFELNAGAGVLENGRSVPPEAAEEAEAKLDAAYAEAVPTDSLLVARFEAHLRTHPEAYGALES